jgi:ABC-2 type transport system permease protein
MWALFKKELSYFLYSFTGYVIMAVFLIMTGLVLWILPGSGNIADAGFATLDPLFGLAPYFFLFLIPAITMKSFSEEMKSGTLEFLLTKPLSELAVIMAKHLAGVLLLLVSLLPTSIYYISVYQLGNPVGNIDSGATWGSYIGLLLLGSSFVSVGVFCSALTENQVVAFILAVFASFLSYSGFSSAASIPIFSSIQFLLDYLSIDTHYSSISRGVVDSRDVIYFITFNAVFIFSTKLVIEKRKW